MIDIITDSQRFRSVRCFVPALFGKVLSFTQIHRALYGITLLCQPRSQGLFPGLGAGRENALGTRLPSVPHRRAHKHGSRRVTGTTVIAESYR